MIREGAGSLLSTMYFYVSLTILADDLDMISPPTARIQSLMEN